MYSYYKEVYWTMVFSIVDLFDWETSYKSYSLLNSIKFYYGSKVIFKKLNKIFRLLGMYVLFTL